MSQLHRKLFAVLVVLTLALAGCGGQQVAQNAPAQPAPAVDVNSLPVNIDTQTVDSLRNRDDVLIVDVREDWEYAEGHIPGATLIPLGQIPDRISEIPKDKTVVAVCRSGNRSGQATKFLRQQGFDNVHNMQGGMNVWAQSGFEIAR